MTSHSPSIPPVPVRQKSSSFTVLSAVVLASTALLLPGAASAQPASSSAPNHPGFAFGAPSGEALLVLGAALSNASAALPQRATSWGPDAPHPHDRTADRISDFTGGYAGAPIAFLAGFGLEAGYFGEAGVRGGIVYAERTALVEIESLLFDSAVVNGLKRLTGRCRPLDFVDGQCTAALRDAFPSGHTAPMGALAGSRLLLAAQSTGPSGYRWGSFAMAEVMALTTAWLRVRAGKHSWSDVGAGFLIGHAIGLLVAAAHPMTPVPRGDLTPSDGSIGQGGFGLTWSETF